jgi:hypothetical protein
MRIPSSWVWPATVLEIMLSTLLRRFQSLRDGFETKSQTFHSNDRINLSGAPRRNEARDQGHRGEQQGTEKE